MSSRPPSARPKWFIGKKLLRRLPRPVKGKPLSREGKLIGPECGRKDPADEEDRQLFEVAHVAHRASKKQKKQKIRFECFILNTLPHPLPDACHQAKI
jgi:hypothetical protein